MNKTVKIVFTPDEFTWLKREVSSRLNDLEYLRLDKNAQAHDYFQSEYEMIFGLNQRIKVLYGKEKSKN